MNHQEMQFADPDWQPRDEKKRPDSQEPEPYIPQPVNLDPREQPLPQEAPVIPPLSQGPYQGYGSQQRVVGGQYAQPRRRSRSPWFWIILALIIVSLMGSGINGAFQNRLDGMRFPGEHSVMVDTQNFAVSGQPTLVINEAAGTIDVHTGSSNTVTIRASERGNPNEVHYTKSADGNTINVNVDNANFMKDGGVDFDVTVPANTNLQLATQAGDITVDGVNGQLSLTATAGDVTAQNGILSGQSTLKSTAGSVTFNGSLDPTGSYRFESGAGSVDVTVASNSAFHVDASSDLGSINTDIPGVIVQSNTGPGNTAQGDVGNPPRASVTLRTGAGSIDLHQGS